MSKKIFQILNQGLIQVVLIHFILIGTSNIGKGDCEDKITCECKKKNSSIPISNTLQAPNGWVISEGTIAGCSIKWRDKNSETQAVTWCAEKLKEKGCDTIPTATPYTTWIH